MKQSITLMVQGTTSDAGKTTLVAALGRIFHQRGYKVAPFKPQNMALNSAVTADGGEIGRGQAVQAQACGVAAHTDMNPILLKPCSDTGAQVIVQGRALSDMEAAQYHDYKATAMAAVLESYQRLQTQYDIIVVEGAGSPAEINLREGDIANMGFAEAVDCPVIIIADIDKGGVFAHLVGTLALLSSSEQARVIGFVINRFRGDLSLLQPGLDWIDQETGKPVLGVIPYINKLHLEAEDALSENVAAQSSPNPDTIKVRVPVWPRISNHTDFDALRLHPQIDFAFVGPGQALADADLIILPGSKNVRADLEFMRAEGWDNALLRHLRYGGKVLGICGGMQMLGAFIDDPLGIEGEAGRSKCLGLLDFSTELAAQKILRNVSGTLQLLGQSASVSGYEIHAGVSCGAGLTQALIQLPHGRDGCSSDDGQIIASYLHGLFDDPQAAKLLLRWAGLAEVATQDYRALVDAELNRLAAEVAASVDTEALLKLAAGFNSARQ